jgi:hypothetical protein
MDSDNIKFELRLFLPLVQLGSIGEDGTNVASKYGMCISDLQLMFDNVSSLQNKDDGDSVRMAYVVGCNHWGAKYRGEKQKLEVKYRTHTVSLGGSRDCVEAYKKKDYGKKSIDVMASKILEKLYKHCSYEHNDELAAISAKAIQDNTICSMLKWRKHVLFEELESSCRALVEYAYIEVDPMYNEDRGDGDIDMNDKDVVVHIDNNIDGKPATIFRTRKPCSSTIKKWISIAIEGTYESIQRCVKTSFHTIFEALQAGYDANIPVLVAGYPTFVANQDLHAISIQSGINPETGRNHDQRYDERVTTQRLQVAQLLQYIEVERIRNDRIV